MASGKRSESLYSKRYHYPIITFILSVHFVCLRIGKTSPSWHTLEPIIPAGKWGGRGRGVEEKRSS